MLKLPSILREPRVVSGKIVSKVMLDLTVYLDGPSETEFAFLISLFRQLCPADRLVKYKIAEFDHWVSLTTPLLTATGRDAAKRGIADAFLEPARRRIREGRAFEVQFWDGMAIGDPNGSWSFNCQAISRKTSGKHSFVRYLFPLDCGLDRLILIASAVAENVRFRSGHGGFCFVFDPWFLSSAFDSIYGQARRFWGVDIEDLNHTLPLMKKHIKGVNWLSLICEEWVGTAGIRANLRELERFDGITLADRRFGRILQAGPEPTILDQNRPASEHPRYQLVAQALAPLILPTHPDFPGSRFIAEGNSLGWIRRFIEPDGWR